MFTPASASSTPAPPYNPNPDIQPEPLNYEVWMGKKRFNYLSTRSGNSLGRMKMESEWKFLLTLTVNMPA